MNKLFDIKGNRISFLCTFLGLLAICLLPVLYHELFNNGSLSRFITSLIYTLPICLILMCIRPKWLFVLLSGLLTVMSVMETFMVVLYGNYLVAGNILAVFNTTTNESTDFIQNTFHAFPYIVPVLIAYGISVFFSRKFQKPWFFISAAVFFVILSSVIIYTQSKKAKQTYQFYITQNVLERPPYNFPHQLMNIIEQQKVRRLIAESESMSFGAKHEAFEGKETYVLAIGESCRYSNMSINGYNRKTTPLLEQINNITAYSNYYSAANLTMYSVPQILTRATTKDYELNYKEKGIYKPFQECGFKTYVICCDNLLTYEKYLTKGVDSLFCVENDKDIPHLIDSLSNKHLKTFFIVQFWGNHSFYKNFDDERNVYHPNIVSEPDSKDSNLYLNSYDNTVLYTDFVLSSIIKSIDTPNTQSAFIFVSDHGEDFRPGTGGHGGNSKPNKEEYHVPFIIWHNDTWMSRHQVKAGLIKINKDKPINSDNVFYTMCDMADIQLDKQYAKPSLSVLSEKLELHDRYLIVPDGKNVIKLK